MNFLTQARLRLRKESQEGTNKAKEPESYPDTPPEARESNAQGEVDLRFDNFGNLKLERLQEDLDLFYVPEAVTREEEEALLELLEHQQWTELTSRKLQCYEGVSEEVRPRALSRLAKGLSEAPGLNLLHAIEFNHILVNQYQPHEGIMHHEDGPVYKPRVVILSLNDSCIMSFRRKVAVGQDANNAHSLVLRPRSLLIFTGALYDAHLHGILPDAPVNKVDETCRNCDAAGVCVGQEVERNRLRTSITFRERIAPASTSEMGVRVVEVDGRRDTKDTLKTLINGCYNEGEEGIIVHPFERVNDEEIGAMIANQQLLVLYLKGSISGCVKVDVDKGEWGCLAVTKVHQGKGLGNVLVAAAEARLRESGHKEARLELLAPRSLDHSHKERLRRWYLRMGYSLQVPDDLTASSECADKGTLLGGRFPLAANVFFTRYVKSLT